MKVHLNALLKGGVFIAWMMVLAACNMPAPKEKQDQSSLQSSTLTAAASVVLPEAPTSTPTPTPIPSATQAPSPSPIPPSLTPSQTATSTAVPTQDCTNRAEFVEDLSAKDGSIYASKEPFVKAWRLKNAGTCTWNSQYQLVFVEGDPMGAASLLPLTEDVPPGKKASISVSLVAPAANGAYEGYWKIRSPLGIDFGIGKNADNSFWVKINVSESAAELDLGSPSWQDTFKNNANWYLLDTSNVHWSIKDGSLVMRASSPEQGDEWGLATHPKIDNFYLAVTFKTGSECSGKDRYGVLVRAPSQNSGYVFGFSCEGKYRLYKWDGANYIALKEWTASSSIKDGPDQTNLLGILADGKTLKLYANGKLLAELEDGSYQEGRFGLFIGSTNTSGLEVFVEDIAIWDLNK